MSLAVGIALGAAAVIALVSGNVLGLAAANIWTETLWGACAVILLFNTAIPRRKKAITDDPAPAREPERVEPAQRPPGTVTEPARRRLRLARTDAH